MSLIHELSCKRSSFAIPASRWQQPLSRQVGLFCVGAMTAGLQFYLTGDKSSSQRPFNEKRTNSSTPFADIKVGRAGYHIKALAAMFSYKKRL